MSTPLTPASPKATDAGLPAVGKYAEKPAATKPIVDRIDTAAKESSEGVLACLQSLACSIWGCVSGIFSWVLSWVYTPVNAELLKDPLKQMKDEFPSWRSENGPIKTMIEEMRKTASFSSFHLEITLECHVKGNEQDEIFHCESFGKQTIATFEGEQAKAIEETYQPAFDIFIDIAKQKFVEGAENYIDFSRGDVVKMQMRGAIEDPTNRAAEGKGTFHCWNILTLTQYWEKGVAQPIERRAIRNLDPDDVLLQNIRGS